MSEVSALKFRKREAKLAAELNRRADIESDERPKERRRAKVWDEARRGEEEAASRAKRADIERQVRNAWKKEERVAREAAEDAARQHAANLAIEEKAKQRPFFELTGDVAEDLELTCLEAFNSQGGGLVAFRSTRVLKLDSPRWYKPYRGSDEDDKAQAVVIAEADKVAEEEVSGHPPQNMCHML